VLFEALNQIKFDTSTPSGGVREVFVSFESSFTTEGFGSFRRKLAQTRILVPAQILVPSEASIDNESTSAEGEAVNLPRRNGLVVEVCIPSVVSHSEGGSTVADNTEAPIETGAPAMPFQAMDALYSRWQSLGATLAADEPLSRSARTGLPEFRTAAPPPIDASSPKNEPFDLATTNVELVNHPHSWDRRFRWLRR
jgi:hypothetical protein